MTLNQTIPKDGQQHAVPVAWRTTLSQIVRAIKEDRLSSLDPALHVRAVLPDDVLDIRENIRAYGVTLVELPADSWKTSVCMWSRAGFWNVMVDLHSLEEGRSDLVLGVRIVEEGDEYNYEVEWVHVP